MNFDPAFTVTHGMHITKQQWKTTTKQRWKKKKRHLTTPWPGKAGLWGAYQR